MTGGKSKSRFYISYDEKLVFKQISPKELKFFKEMGFGYFEYLCKSFGYFNPSALAKILGAFKIKKVDVRTGKSRTICLFMMENLSLGLTDSPNIVKYDLKGSNIRRFISKP